MVSGSNPSGGDYPFISITARMIQYRMVYGKTTYHQSNTEDLVRPSLTGGNVSGCAAAALPRRSQGPKSRLLPHSGGRHTKACWGEGGVWDLTPPPWVPTRALKLSCAQGVATGSPPRRDDQPRLQHKRWSQDNQQKNVENLVSFSFYEEVSTKHRISHLLPAKLTKQRDENNFRLFLCACLYKAHSKKNNILQIIFVTVAVICTKI